jgi:N-acetylneuraminic acid mutarotase
LFIYGGITDTYTTISSVYTFNPQSNSWSITKITGDSPSIIYAEMAIINHNGIMYFWNGINLNFNILDTINLVWKKGNSIDAPKLETDSAATLLSDNTIIYFGKQASNSVILNNFNINYYIHMCYTILLYYYFII